MDQFDVIIVGTGFASSFFLVPLLETLPLDARILVLERGPLDSHAWQVANRRNTSFSRIPFENATAKFWYTNIGFGGGSNCWWGCTPRMMPNDFRLKTKYGVGRDWPVSYDDLEMHYTRAEELMVIAGPERTPYPKSKHYPLPPHRLSRVDDLLQRAHPGQVFAMPTARASRATKNRGACCASSVCWYCPTNAKFTVQNELVEFFQDPRVTLRLNTRVMRVSTQGGVASGVSFTDEDGREQEVRADLVVLGANAIGNAEILLRSKLNSGPVGQGLNEQISVTVTAYLDGVNALQGGTSLTAHGYNFYDGEHRKERAACLVEHSNMPHLRAEYGRWREVCRFKMIYEDLPQPSNTVTLNETGSHAITTYRGHTSYAQKSISRARQDAQRYLSALPIEDLCLAELSRTENHVMGTVVMGNDEKTSVVDRHLVHHRIRNLLVLGCSAFPTTPPANPTLTAAALSLWACEHLATSRPRPR